MTARDELINALARRYAVAGRAEKTRILDEFVAIAGFHRKHAMRLLRCDASARRSEGKASRRIYDEAVREAIVVLWEASDRICGKRLKALMPVLVEAMERHGAPETRCGDPRRGTRHERVDDRPVASRGPRAGERQEAPSGGCAIVGPQEHSGAHVLRLGRSAAGVRRGRPRCALRPDGERELRAKRLLSPTSPPDGPSAHRFCIANRHCSGRCWARSAGGCRSNCSVSTRTTTAFRERDGA